MWPRGAHTAYLSGSGLLNAAGRAPSYRALLVSFPVLPNSCSAQTHSNECRYIGVIRERQKEGRKRGWKEGRKGGREEGRKGGR